MLHSLLEDGRPEQPKLHHEVVRTGPSKDK
jgi:hypothetical protein